MINFILITNDTDLAVYAERCGVTRILVDLERIGKQERQGHLDTLMSFHSVTDVAAMKANLESSKLMVRVNPLHSETPNEVEEVIDAGAELLMLPMFRNVGEVQAFAEMVDHRIPIVPLVETSDAAADIGDIARLSSVSEVYIGLNDLHLDLNLKFMFEPLANGIVDALVEQVKSAGKPFGFGGIARVGEGIVPGDLVLAEHVRLGSSSVILSRTFNRGDGAKDAVDSDFSRELEKLMSCYESLQFRSPQQIESDRGRLKRIVDEFVSLRR